jgi:Uma2 family endonuclease
MATTPRHRAKREIDYPTSDGKPMAETELHRDIMVDLIETLKDHFAADPMVFVTGDLLLFYEEGNRRKHVAPDVFVVRGVPKLPRREHYLMWREDKGPDVVIEVTSKTTRAEDQKKKLTLYRDALKVPEYFLFDPREEWLKPSLQGHRLTAEGYIPIGPVAGRLPSEVLGLHLSREGVELRLFDPQAGRRLPTFRERIVDSEAGRLLLETRLQLAEARLELAEERLARSEAERRLAEMESDRLRRELEVLRGRPPEGP